MTSVERLAAYFLVLCINFTAQAYAGDAFLYHLSATPNAGEGVSALFARYRLAMNECNIHEFYRLNKMQDGQPIHLGRTYEMPIKIYRYDGKSIRSTIGQGDLTRAKRIQRYNEDIHAAKIRKTDYRASRLLWVPYDVVSCLESATVRTYPVLGQESSLETKSNALSGKFYYLVAGHGGPDPGALGQSGNHTLCEDEYAYDVVLRLYKLILEHGGKAELVIQDANDGIRDNRILPCDQDETCNGQALPINQLKRLRQRVDHINTIYRKRARQGIKDQTCISIHVDSRSQRQRQDVFFCHYGLSKGGESLAHALHRTFAQKYKKHRPNGRYAGTVEKRNLFVLKNTIPKAVLIELANIRNTKDHKRILLKSNRQALAQWIFEGLRDTAES